MSSTLHAAKKILRKEIKSRISQLTEEMKTTQSKHIAEKLFSMKEFKESQRIAIYLSMPSEVNTYRIMQKVFEEQKNCFIPHYVGEDMKMVILRDMQDFNELPSTTWNIKQPSDNEQRENAIESGGLDLILVPGLGFTKGGLRLGRGKGYYDNYLKKYKKQFGKAPFTIGLSFKEQICDSIPVTENDFPIDFVLS